MTSERPFTRPSILDSLARRRAAGEPIVSASAGIGLVARAAEAAGIDLLSVQVNGISRHLGVPTTTTLGNATSLTMDAYAEIANVVDRTPIIGGIEATDGTRRDLRATIARYRDLGFDGIANFPTVGSMPTWADIRGAVGEGIGRDYDLIRQARDADLFTIAHAYTADHAAALAASGADVIVARCGATAGGFVGQPRENVSLEGASDHVQSVVVAVRSESPDTYVVAHGGPFATPEDAAHLFAHTDVDGVHGESAIERIPIEVHVARQVAAFKNQRIRTS